MKCIIEEKEVQKAFALLCISDKVDNITEIQKFQER